MDRSNSKSSGSIKQVFIFFLLIIICVVGFGYYFKKNQNSSDKSHSNTEENREPASSTHDENEENHSDAHHDQHDNHDKEVKIALHASLHGHSENSGKNNSPHHSNQAHQAEDSSDESESSSDDFELCRSIEIQSFGEADAEISDKDWKTLIDEFHKAKKTIIIWLMTNHEEFPDETVALMKTQLEKIKLVRPPTKEMADLNWRGIGAWTRDETGQNLIYVSRGLLRLVLNHPRRGQFEVTRLVAQSIAPCELEKQGGKSIWTPLLSCLQVQETKNCKANEVSESGWAISTSLATLLAPPECTVPIFQSKGKKNCLSQLVTHSIAKKPAKKVHEKEVHEKKSDSHKNAQKQAVKEDRHHAK